MNKQTDKQTNNCEVARKYTFFQGNHPKTETTKSVNYTTSMPNCHLYGFKDRMECQFHGTLLLNKKLIF
jgi:hypothetical protein